MSSKERILQQWRNKADNDLLAAKILLSTGEPLYDNVCGLCQQAAEKYIKALLFSLNIDFKKSHDLNYLLDLLASVEKTDESLLDIAEFLTPFAVDIRYPGEIEVASDDAREAYQGAQHVREFVLRELGS